MKPKSQILIAAFMFSTFIVLSILVIIALILQKQNSHKLSDPKDLENIRATTVKINNNCKKILSDQSPCYEESIQYELLSKYTPAQILEAIYDFDIYYSCHAFSHFLGRSLYQATQSIADSYAQINFTCHGGSYHGVMEKFLDQNKINLDTLDGQKLRTICQDSKKLTTLNPEQIFTECLHGFGHAFMFITESDLPKSLFYCDRLDTIDERERCYGGAFMENSTSSTNRDHKSAWIKPGDKFFPCTVLQEHYLNQCYFYQANYLIMSTNRNYPSVFADCEKLISAHRAHCILGIGASLASVSNEQGTQTAAAICSIGKKDTQALCIGSAVSSLFARYGGETGKILQLCTLVAENLKEPCFAKIGEYAKSWGKTKEELDTICIQAGTYKETCHGKTQTQIN